MIKFNTKNNKQLTYIQSSRRTTMNGIVEDNKSTQCEKYNSVHMSGVILNDYVIYLHYTQINNKK